MAEETKTPIFIVEDDEAWAASLTAKLSKKYSVSHFVSGEACMEKLQLIKPKLIIMDYHLEGAMTGLDALKESMKLRPETYVIMFSSQDDIQTAIDTLDNGAYDYIPKGENAFNKLNIILRNIRKTEDLRGEVIQLSLKMRRDRFWVFMVVVLIFFISSLIYFNTCPYGRIINWDPFNINATKSCFDPKKKNIDKETVAPQQPAQGH